MEKAIALNSREIRKKGKTFFEKWDAVYVGSEFCQNIYLSPDDIKFLKDKGAKKIVLTTTIMVGSRLRETKKLLDKIFKICESAEIVINDIGLLLFLNKNHPAVPIGLGRPVSIDYIRMKPSFLSAFIKEYRIQRLESDETEMINNLPPNMPFKITYHYPFKFIAMTRYCPYEGKLSLNCGYSCRGKEMKLKVPGTNAFIFAKNNAYFFKVKPEIPLNAERIVKHIS